MELISRRYSQAVLTKVDGEQVGTTLWLFNIAMGNGPWK